MKGLRHEDGQPGPRRGPRIFTLWPEWRDYDWVPFFVDKGLYDLIFTLWPEWRDYDVLSKTVPVVRARSNFYLVTWMKGLRLWASTAFRYRLSRFLPCDLNEGITTWIKRILPPPSYYFYLVTWMKGLRHTEWLFESNFIFQFLPCDLNEGITTFRKASHASWYNSIFTLWPEWRDYDYLEKPY